MITVLATLFSYSQTKEIIYADANDSNSNYYIAFKPEKQAEGLLLLLTSFGERPEIAMNETSIQNTASAKGLITVFASLQMGTANFFIDSASQVTLDHLIPMLQQKYHTQNKPFYLGAFSLGGAGVVKYAERAYASPMLIKPKAIFAIDPPLDFERVYYSLKETMRQSKTEVALREADYFLKRIEFEFQGTPYYQLKSFHKLSPYSYSDTLHTNIKPLVNCPVMLLSEPDLIWQMEERGRSINDLNIMDCSSMINSLKLMGNKKALLVISSGKGYRKLTGKRNPHSWSIAESEAVINWLIGQ
ncbi:MAG: hypothetical protein H7296_01795 [Bacteroidia bacterium]|nr:hypothetical protein [Bacteroidia bacterium]